VASLNREDEDMTDKITPINGTEAQHIELGDPVNYETPDWTPEEMRQEPPFRYAMTRLSVTRKSERRTDYLVVACVLTAVAGAVWLVLGGGL
jgi:hypothetical protein